MKIYVADCGFYSGGYSMYLKGELRNALFSFYDLTDSWAKFRVKPFEKMIGDMDDESSKNTKNGSSKSVGKRKARNRKKGNY